MRFEAGITKCLELFGGDPGMDRIDRVDMIGRVLSSNLVNLVNPVSINSSR